MGPSSPARPGSRLPRAIYFRRPDNFCGGKTDNKSEDGGAPQFVKHPASAVLRRENRS